MTTVSAVTPNETVSENGLMMKDVANFIRFCGIVAVLAGGLMVLGDIWHTIAELLISNYSGSPTEQVGSVIVLIARTLIVFALPALYLHHASAAGRFGFLAFTVAMLGNTLMVASDWSEVFVAPVLRELDPSLFENPPARIIIGFLVNFVPETLGWVLFGISAYRTRVFPRLASALLALGILLIFLPFSPPWIYIIPFSAIAWMGLVVARGRSFEQGSIA